MIPQIGGMGRADFYSSRRHVATTAVQLSVLPPPIAARDEIGRGVGRLGERRQKVGDTAVVERAVHPVGRQGDDSPPSSGYLDNVDLGAAATC